MAKQYYTYKETGCDYKARTGIRNGYFVTDKTITDEGFLGLENTDWINISSKRLPLPYFLTDLILAYYIFDELSDGKIPNKIDDGATWLSVIDDTPGAESYQVPNTQEYIDADTDYIWFYTNVTQRPETTKAELIGYDLPRTIVFYDDNSPYDIREIIIFKSTTVVTTALADLISSLFRLHYWWNGSFNDNGFSKDNRGSEQLLWVPEIIYVEADKFISSWKTDNTGDTNSTSIGIPTDGSNYDCFIDWGDGSAIQNVVGAPPGNRIDHDYGVAGTYIVKIWGIFAGISFVAGVSLDKAKLINISQWGTMKWRFLRFATCRFMTMTATDYPDTELVTSLARAFDECQSCNPNFANINVSNVISMYWAFRYCNSFNRNLANWDISKVNDMSNFTGGYNTWSTANYSATLIAWAAKPVLVSGVTLLVYNTTKYLPAAAAARAFLISNWGWNITDGGPA